MHILVAELKHAVRALARQPGSSLISTLILALGIGLSTFMFAVVYGVLFRGLDVPGADRIAVVEMVDTRDDDGQRPRSHDYLDFRERLRSFEALSAYYGGTFNLADDRAPERYSGVWVTAEIFAVLRVQPLLGRTIGADEDRPGLPPVVLIGHDVWRDRYGSDPGVLGHDIRANGRQGTIIGVMPEGFRWPSDHDIWVSMDDDPLAVPRGEGRGYAVLGRLADGVTWEQADREVARVAAELAREHPEENELLSARLITVNEQQNGDEIRVIFTAMMAAVLCVLLVACANVASLLLARAASRTREAGVRVALGAGRLRVMAPFLTEALILACGGALVGTVLAYRAVDLFDRVTATPITGRPYFMIFEVDFPVLLYVVGITTLTALAAGVAPALQVSRADLNTFLNDESRGSSGLRLGRLSKGLVMIEVALSVALLVGAGLMTKSMVQLYRYELPFDTAALISGRVALTETVYPERADRQAFWRDLERRLQGLPGVASAALSGSVPGTGTGTAAVVLEGEAVEEPSERPRAHFQIISSGYFETLGVSLLGGEDFGDADTQEAPRVAVVNESFARRSWPDGSPLGRTFRTGTGETDEWIRVIGVAPDLNMEGFDPTDSSAAGPEGFYVPVAQSSASFLSVVARPVTGAPQSLAPTLREALRAIDPDLPLYDLQGVDAAIYEATWFYSVFGSIFVIFGLAALFMASVGLYGVLSFSVSRRVREMGIRMALGAGDWQVTRLVLRQAATQILVGSIAGLVLAAGVSRVVEVLMFRVNARDPAVFAGVVALIVAVGLAAGLVPARRATGVDPMVALRSE